MLAKVGWDVERLGLQGAPPVTVVTHAGSHATIYASLQMLGLGREGERVRKVDADDQGRIRPDALRAELATIDGPVIVCAQAGNVNTGAFDPFEDVARIVHERGGWLHVDGAFGIWAAAVPSLRDRMRGHAEADSWSTDAHKWLNVPYDSGLVFVRDAAAHHAAMTFGASYYVETAGGERDPYATGCPNRRVAPGDSRSSRRCARWGGPGWSTSSSATARSPAGWPSDSSAQPGVTILNEVVLNQVLVGFETRRSDARRHRRRPA